MCGGVKVVFQHAGLLAARGHDVTILARGARPDWIGFSGTYQNWEGRTPSVASQDLVIATWWETIPVAETMMAGPVIHFCQGFEGDLVHLAPARPRIEEVYRRPLPAFVVSAHLGDLLRTRFGRESFEVRPPLDPLFRPAWRFGPRRHPWVIIPGIFEAEVKGIRHALAAIRLLRERGLPCRVHRLSILPLSDEERALLPPDIYRCGIPPAQVARELRRADLLMFPSLPMEGFGLPVIEAMASGVPVVASDIPGLRSIPGPAMTRVPAADPEALAAAASRLLRDRSAWRAARRCGFEAARAFEPGPVSDRLEAAVRWAESAVRRSA